jgi:hypothetical protein
MKKIIIIIIIIHKKVVLVLKFISVLTVLWGYICLSILVLSVKKAVKWRFNFRTFDRICGV